MFQILVFKPNILLLLLYYYTVHKCADLYFSGDRNGVLGRENAHQYDLNRNFPDQFLTNAENRVTQVETSAVMAWLDEYPFVLSANLHGGTLVANYPYDDNKAGQSAYSKCPDDDIFRQLAESYSLVS